MTDWIPFLRGLIIVLLFPLIILAGVVIWVMIISEVWFWWKTR